MIRTVSIACKLPSKVVDALNRESGRIHTEVMVEHYRMYRNHRLWLSNPKMQKYHDRISGPSFLHVHSIDAAQSISKQAFGRIEELAIQQTKTLKEVVGISKKDQPFLGPKQTTASGPGTQDQQSCGGLERYPSSGHSGNRRCARCGGRQETKSEKPAKGE
jgi:hypothetical protein